MAREKTRKAVFTFETTTQAMKMEREAGRAGAPGRLIPVPREISAGCGMAWCAPAQEKERLAALAADWGVEVEDVYELLL